MNDFTLHIAPYIDSFTNYLLLEFGGFFAVIADLLLWFQTSINDLLLVPPTWVFIFAFVAISVAIGGWRLALVTFISLGYIAITGLWGQAMSTLATISTATIFSLGLGIPIGILMAESPAMRALIKPMPDLMQTMPAFVLLVPAVYFFGVGVVGGIAATIVFAMPLPIRLTAHGLSMTDREAIEAGQSFGCTRSQLLLLIKLPLAFRSVMAGINQCIMLSLSMVITASFIGAGGLGDEIIRAISRLQIGRGVESGLAIVCLAIFLDRLSTEIGNAIDPTAELPKQGMLRWLWSRRDLKAPAV